MADAAQKIADGFMEQSMTPPSITAQDSMETIADKVGNAFVAAAPLVENYEAIGAQDSMSVIADKVEGNFRKMEDELTSGTFTFLHTSDPHGSTRNGTGGVEQMVAMMNEPGEWKYRFGCISGDMKPYYATSSTLYDTLLKGSSGMRDGKLIAIAGNHDACDRWSSDTESANYACYDQQRTTNWLKNLLGSAAIGNKVVWGDTDGLTNTPILSAYYYQDFVVGRRKVRVICMDQYDFDQCLAEHNAANPNNQLAHRTAYYTYYTAYSQKQVNWFVNLLKVTDCPIIIVTHDGVAVQTPVVYADGEYNDEALFFTSEYDGDYQVNGGAWIPKVVDAWMSKKAISGSFEGTVPYGTSNTSIFKHKVTFDDSFVGVNTGKLICYLAGHTHYDLSYWCDKEIYPGQLQLVITASTSSQSFSNPDDLLTGGEGSNIPQVVPSEPPYRVNRMTYDMEAHTLLVERIGQQTAALRSDPTKTRVRDKLLFDLETMEVTHPNG